MRELVSYREASYLWSCHQLLQKADNHFWLVFQSLLLFCSICAGSSISARWTLSSRSGRWSTSSTNHSKSTETFTTERCVEGLIDNSEENSNAYWNTCMNDKIKNVNMSGNWISDYFVSAKYIWRIRSKPFARCFFFFFFTSNFSYKG